MTLEAGCYCFLLAKLCKHIHIKCFSLYNVFLLFCSLESSFDQYSDLKTFDPEIPMIKSDLI